jgi:polyadenylate-binding protein
MDSTTLYVGDLPEATTAADLEAFFIGFQIQPVLHKNNKNEIYAIIQVENSVIAHAIIDKFNYTEFKGKEIRICYFVPKLKKEIEGNLYFKAPKEMKMRQIYTILHSFGEIINLKLSQLPNGGSRGYGYVQFSKKDEAEKALAGVNILYRKNSSKILESPLAYSCPLSKGSAIIFM